MEIDKVKDVANSLEGNAEILQSIIDKVVNSYVVDLNDYLSQVGEIIDSSNYSIDDLERIILKLSNMLYFISPKVEKTGVKQSLAKILRDEKYNNSYIKNDVMTIDESGKKTKPTIATNQALSQQESEYEAIVQTLYESAYKSLKQTVMGAYEQLSSIKKVLSSRMLEMQLNNSSNDSNCKLIRELEEEI